MKQIAWHFVKMEEEINNKREGNFCINLHKLFLVV